MKRIFAIAVLLSCIVSVFACSKTPAENISTTGYKSEEIQRTYLYCEGQLYIYNDEMERIGEGLTLLGKVESEDSASYPHTEFASAHLAVGQGIYRKEGETEEKIYVQTKEGSNRYMIFVPAE